MPRRRGRWFLAIAERRSATVERPSGDAERSALVRPVE
jgi:hypothetical protein